MMLAPAVLSAVRRYLRALADQGIAVNFGVLFGSQVTGRADPWRGIDLVVVSPRFDGPIAREDVNRLWRVAARTDSRIEPVPCGAHQWGEDTSSAIIEIARRDGATIALGTEG